MFTGIIEGLGTVERVAPGRGGGRTLTLRPPFDLSGLALGDSVATNGVCLTATSLKDGAFTADAGPETLLRTTIGTLTPGTRVNMERAVTLATRLGGHLVQGHVDAVGRILGITRRDNAYDVTLGAPPEVLRLVIARGSVTLDGISLTVTAREAETFGVSIIPHTWQVTACAAWRVGQDVNVEADLVARYVDGLLSGRDAPAAKPGLTAAFLREHGF